MKNVIFYFTGTGNSLSVARKIASELEDCEIKLITNFKEDMLDEGYERLGFVFPVYAMRIPKCVFEFLENVDFTRNSEAYFFAVSTQGGSTGISLPIVDKLLKKQGLGLHGAYDIKMFSNYVILYDMAEEYDFSDEVVNVKSIVDGVVAKKRTGNLKKINGIIDRVTKFGVSTFAVKDKGFNVSSDCTGCGICEKVCPASNIELVDSKPTFKHQCEQCVACIQICPTKAINYKSKTQNRRRYINPEISIQDLYVEGK